MMSTKSLIAITALVVVVYAVVNVTVSIHRARSYPEYWRARSDEPVRAGDLRMVALGDSATMAVGASRAQDGFVGRIEEHVRSETGRTVHVDNVSTGGATAGDVVREQLPLVDPHSSDLVIVAISNDLEKRRPLERYREDLTKLLSALPAERTVVSDLPLMPGREPYQRVLQQVADGFGVRRADFARIFRNEGRRLDIFSWLPPHLNSKGYAYWYQAFRPAVDEILAARRDKAD